MAEAQTKVLEGLMGGLNNLLPSGLNTLVQEMVPIPTPTKTINFLIPAGIMGGATVLNAVILVVLPLVIKKYPLPGLAGLGNLPNPLAAFQQSPQLSITNYAPFPA